MFQDPDSLQYRSGMSEGRRRRAKLASTPVSTLASTVDDTDLPPQEKRGYRRAMSVQGGPQ
jgi:hypothetical protein